MVGIQNLTPSLLRHSMTWNPTDAGWFVGVADSIRDVFRRIARRGEICAEAPVWVKPAPQC
jgi:hypothetical protein